MFYFLQKMWVVVDVMILFGCHGRSGEYGVDGGVVATLPTPASWPLDCGLCGEPRRRLLCISGAKVCLLPTF